MWQEIYYTARSSATRYKLHVPSRRRSRKYLFMSNAACNLPKKLLGRKKTPQIFCSPSNQEPQQRKSVSAVRLRARRAYPTVYYYIQEQFDVVFFNSLKESSPRPKDRRSQSGDAISFFSLFCSQRHSFTGPCWTKTPTQPGTAASRGLGRWVGSSPERRRAEAKGGERKCQVLLMKSRSSPTAQNKYKCKAHTYGTRPYRTGTGRRRGVEGVLYPQPSTPKPLQP